MTKTSDSTSDATDTQQQQQQQHATAALESAALLSATLDEDAAAQQMAEAGGRSWGAIAPRTRAHRVLSHVNESVGAYDMPARARAAERAARPCCLRFDQA